MGSSQKIAKGVFWTTLVNLVNGLYGFISVPILLAYFGKSDYGLIGLAMSVNVYLRLMDMGLNSTNVRFFSNWIAKKEYEQVNKLFQTSLTFYGTIGLLNALILVVVSCFSQQIFHLSTEQDIIVKHLFYILAISAFISWFTSCFDQLIRANENVDWTQKITLLPKMVQMIVLALTVLLHFSIELYYALTAFSMFLVIPFCVHKIRKICPYVSFHLGFDKRILKDILPYCLNIFSFGIFQFSMNYLRPVFLGMQGTIESVADYRVLNGIISIVLMLGGAFMGVFLPSSAKAVAKGDKVAQDKVAYNGTKYISMTLCFCCFGVISVCPELITLYVGEEYLYLTAWLIVWLLTTLAAHNQAISSLIMAGADIRAITMSTIISSIVGLLVCWFTIPYWQIGGTVIAYGVYVLMQLLFYYFYYWPRVMKINSWKVFIESFMPYVLLGSFIAWGCFSITIFTNSWTAFFTKSILFAISYGFGTFFLLTKEDRLFIINIRKKV